MNIQICIAVGIDILKFLHWLLWDCYPNYLGSDQEEIPNVQGQ